MTGAVSVPSALSPCSPASLYLRICKVRHCVPLSHEGKTSNRSTLARSHCHGRRYGCVRWHTGEATRLLTAAHGNLHTFSTTHGCAIFDVLMPPYDVSHTASHTPHALSSPVHYRAAISLWAPSLAGASGERGARLSVLQGIRPQKRRRAQRCRHRAGWCAALYCTHCTPLSTQPTSYHQWPAVSTVGWGSMHPPPPPHALRWCEISGLSGVVDAPTTRTYAWL